MIPAFPLPVAGINYNFRCEAVTNCDVGRLGWNEFIEICLGIGSAEFKRMAANYIGRWDLVQLRCSNFMSCTLAERLALILLELREEEPLRGAVHPSKFRVRRESRLVGGASGIRTRGRLSKPPVSIVMRST